jgi:hypothetical protein
VVVCVAGTQKFTDLLNRSVVNLLGDKATALFPFFVAFGFVI